MAAAADKLGFNLDCSFTSISSSSSFLTSTTTTSTSSSARCNLSLSIPSFSSSSLISPHPHSSLWPAVCTASSSPPTAFSTPRLLRHLGSCHLARIFHCRLIKGLDSLDFDFALNATTSLDHIRTEAHVLSSLDYPFLPTLYACMEASHYSCFLIHYCPDSNLHSLLARHPSHKLPIHAVRFFAVEVLLSLEYLHALGFICRDFKPKNVLIRADGHVMLSDFDLCFSAMARDLVKSFLVRDVKGRLVSERGAAKIKSHPFFEGVKWQLMRRKKLPVVVGPAGMVRTSK